MKFLRPLFSYYINTYFHVGIAAASLTAASLYEVTGEVNFFYPFFVFFSTLLAYHFIRIFDECPINKDVIKSRVKTQSWDIILILVVSSLVVSFSLLKFEIVKFLLLLPAFFITFWYAIPLRFLSKKATSLRNHPQLKLISIAIVWSVVTVLIPLQEKALDIQILLLFSQRMLIIMVLVLPFDIRDMLHDNKHLQTLPQQIGIIKTKRIGYLFLVLFLLISIFKQTSSNVIIVEFLISVITGLFVYSSKKNQSNYFASFGVDSIPVFWFILLFFQNI